MQSSFESRAERQYGVEALLSQQQRRIEETPWRALLDMAYASAMQQKQAIFQQPSATLDFCKHTTVES